MTDEQKKQARLLWVDGKSPTEIAEALPATLAQVNAVLGLAGAVEGEAAPPKVREVASVPFESQSMRNARACARINEELRTRLGSPGYRTEPGGGRLRDGRPAPAVGEWDKAFGETSRGNNLGGLTINNRGRRLGL